MKTTFLISVIAGLVIVGCSDSSSKSNSPGTNANGGSGSVLTAPVDYLNSAAKAQQSAVKTVDTVAIKNAIEMFNVQEGRFPKDLNELVEKKYIPQVPTPPHGSKIVYDANTGTVKVEKE
jgi:hypothetical protein